MERFFGTAWGWRPWLFCLLLLLFAVPASAQTTIVSGTITDANGTPYSNGTISATLSPPGVSTPHIGAWQIQAGYGPFSLDGNGNFAMALPDNNQILPAGTKWQFTVNDPGVAPPLGTGPQTCSATVTITGASQVISSSFSCPALASISSATALKPAASAAILYVTALGLDTNDGRSWGTAKLTIQAAINAILALSPPQGTVFIACGTYTVSTGITVNGSGARLNLEGVCSQSATINYTGTTGAALSGANMNIVRNLNLTGPGTGTSTTGIDCTSGSAQFYGLRISGFGTGFIPDTGCSTDLVVQGSEFFANGTDLTCGGGGAGGGENMNFIDDIFTTNGTSMSATSVNITCGGDWNFIGSSFDMEGVTISVAAQVNFFQCHFESLTNAVTNTIFITAGAGGIDLRVAQSKFLQNAATTPALFFIDATGPSVAGGGSVILIGDRFSSTPAMTAVLKWAAGALNPIVIDVNPTNITLTNGNAFPFDRSGNLTVNQLNSLTAGPFSLPSVNNSTLAITSQLPFSGSAAGSTTSLAANSCGDTVTATVTGATTSMTATVSPSADPGTGLGWFAWVSAANTVSVKYCNNTTAAIVPAAATFQVRVIQ